MKKRNWKKYALEFLSIFVAVISAFALNNWNDNRKDDRAESKILTEIYNGLERDSADVAINATGHILGMNACAYWQKIITQQPVVTDSLPQHYFALTRDFVSVQNTSGYETLKSRGFELLKNDELRNDIISLYENDYQILRKLEEEYDEVQFHKNYFHKINAVIAPHFQYDSTGNITGMELPLNLDKPAQNTLQSYLWKININRNFILQSYKDVSGKISALRQSIKTELAK